MGYVVCRSCEGTGKKFVTYDNGRTKEYPCRPCEGTGINQRLYSKMCEGAWCGEEIIYPRDATYEPKYCKYCKAKLQEEREAKAEKWREKACSGCGSTIRYNVDWDKVSEFCPACRDNRKREREATQAKWKEKSCKLCGGTIKYNVEWNKVPELCKSCIEKEKAKWREKTCANCSNSIRYNIDWDKPPELCNSCKEKLKRVCKKCGKTFHANLDWENKSGHITEYCPECRKNNKSNWVVQYEDDYVEVRVSGEYTKSDDRERTDILVKDKITGKHKHFSSDEITNWKVIDWHDWYFSRKK